MWKQKAAEGLRYELEENGRITSFVFAGRDVVTKTDAEGHVTRFLHGYEILSCDSERARTYYHYACDELGSITHVVSGGGEDSAGSLSEDRVLNRYRYDAFGTTVSCEETVENCFRYTGGQYDPMTEQYYLKARFYNPAVARFTQEDTYYGDGLNLYAYCHNNPVSYVDPTGHEAKAAAEKNLIDKYVNGANKYIDKGTDAMLHQVYESDSASGYGNYKFKDGIDVDLRGKGNYQDALNDAFNKTGVSKEDFNVTKWGRDKNGKSFPVEWRANNGAEVSIDLGHSPYGEAPTVPHVGWQNGGKRGNGGALRGHIFIDDVPYNR